MEHKIVRGGNEYLPFARSLIRRLRLTGQSYAAQKVLVGGVTISVRIVGEDEFISIEGGTPEILSGVVKDGEIVNIPAAAGPPPVAAYDTLRAFKPTQNCWDTVLRKNPDKPVTSFNDEKKLAKAGTQYANLAASMFSGLMAKAVQVLMGMGKEIKYDYRASRCHGITTDDKGKLWLVEISATNGIIAKRLTMSPLANNSSEPNDAVRACRDTFKGMLDGRAFPADLAAAIEDGSVLRLMTVEAMEPYFSTLAFHEDLGWTFNDSGTEAYNTCYKILEDESVVSYLYKITFTITDESKTAVLELVEQGELNTVFPDGPRIQFSFDGYSNIQSRQLEIFTPDRPGTAPLFVCHIDGELDVVRCETTPRYNGSFYDPPQNILPNGYWLPDQTYDLYTGRLGGKRVVGKNLQSRQHSEVKRKRFTSVFSRIVASPPVFQAVYRVESDRKTYEGILFWTRGCRDGYANATKDPGALQDITHVTQSAYLEDNNELAFSVEFSPNDPSSLPGYTGPSDGHGYQFFQLFADDGTGSVYLFYPLSIGSAVSEIEIATRYAPNQQIADSDYLGGFADRYGVLRASTFGDNPHQAFTVPPYTYYPDGSPSPVDAGGAHLTGEMLSSEAGSMNHTFNFIGYINVPPT